MAASMNVMPGGIEDDFDEDDDDLCLDDDYAVKKKPAWDPYESSATYNENGVRNFGGFGQPATKPRSSIVKDKREAKGTNAHKQSVGMDDLRTAALRDNVDIIKSLKEKGLDVDTGLRAGWTALMYAANMANYNVVEYLLNNGANPNSHADLYSVLMACCASTSRFTDRLEKCVALLLDKGAEVNAHDRYHLSPLMYAVREGRVGVAKQLVDAGASLDKQDTRGWTALSWAISKNKEESVKFLLVNKADPKKKHCDNTTALDLAELQENSKILALLGSGSAQQQPVTVVNGLPQPQVYQPPLLPNGHVVQEAEVSMGEERYTKCGELELFLGGLDLTNFISLFRGQEVDFATFLRMSDDDLIKMGIHQIGVRKKILDGVHAVHKKEWENTSIPSVQAKHISCADSVAIVANICKHIKYISSTIGFIQDQISAQPQFFKIQDGTSPTQILSHSQDTGRSVADLEKELHLLNKQLQKIVDSGQYDPPDKVKELRVRKSKLNLKRVFMIGLCVGSVGVAFWKRNVIQELCSRYFNTDLSR
ncbi:ankyrin repeat, SAM and basic leucine zipper domain-containing protein 1-like [Mizuhopecten yessoensis]|uniref:Ankyrin repeat, SAM and basic leucine zipper domain-containing protein 1 n=1 Tax=Mizuhopecten yessoensis TaxID=6573 RepID=A0A210R3U4_MIZYE|nr:ankyrin repeat, SAM and basic leucine zipper domain-containing protein 1-like [Mizuhopecten yessoensis]OWF55730.1 Ankyrin repeat, SAM and basic leucine zipper domain-containing protein 1 [Mizuhopecten yessoensis]